MTTSITLWGRRTSCNVQKVMWALAEVGCSYEHVELGGRHGGLDAAYRAMNPNATVPTLRDGDLVLWESHAIVRYLAAQYSAGQLFPTDPARRAILDQWTDWTATEFQPAWIGVFWSFFRTRPTNRNQAAIDKALAAAHRLFAVIDSQLTHSPYLAGDSLSYADIVAGVSLHRWYTMGIETGNYPAVLAWKQRLAQRPGYATAVAADYSELKDGV